MVLTGQQQRSILEGDATLRTRLYQCGVHLVLALNKQDRRILATCGRLFRHPALLATAAKLAVG